MTMDLSGRKLGKYTLQDEIGRGGMGTVYRGHDPALDRAVAVKVLAPHLVWERDFVERFLREARAAGRLQHPNIVTVHDVGEEGGWYYFVMEYLEGEDLKALLQRRGALPAGETLAILQQLAAALDYAHQRGVVHRDVKPGNVIIAADGRVKLTDFGIARAAFETKLTATGAAIGTPEYMAPEQAMAQEVGPWTDLYALGVIAYELLAGRPPFTADATPAVLHLHVYEPLPPLGQVRPDLPPAVGTVLERALAKQPAGRYPTGAAFVGDLEQALRGVAGESVPARSAARQASTQLPEEETRVGRRTGGVREPVGRKSTSPVQATTPWPLPSKAPTSAPAPAGVREQRLAATDLSAAPRPAPQPVLATAQGAQPVETRHGPPAWLWALLGVGLLTALLILFVIADSGVRERTRQSEVATAAALSTAAGRTAAAAGATGAAAMAAAQATATAESMAAEATAAAGATAMAGTPVLAVIRPENADLLSEFRVLESEGWVETVAFSSDGTILGWGGAGGAWLYDLRQDFVMHHLTGHTAQVHCVSFSPDGQTFITSGADPDRTVRLWSIVTGEQELVLAPDLAQSGVCSQANPRNASLVWISGSELWILDLISGQELPLLDPAGNTSGGRPVFSPSGDLVARGGYDGKLRLWRAADGQVLRVLERDSEPIWDLAFSTDGQTLAAGSDDGTVRLWRVSDGALLRTIVGPTGPVHLAFSPDGEILATGTEDSRLRLWRVSDGTLLHTVVATGVGTVLSVAFSPDGRLLVTGSHDSTVRLWGVMP